MEVQAGIAVGHEDLRLVRTLNISTAPGGPPKINYLVGVSPTSRLSTTRRSIDSFDQDRGLPKSSGTLSAVRVARGGQTMSPPPSWSPVGYWGRAPTISKHMLINRGVRMRLNKDKRAAASSVRWMGMGLLVSLIAACSSASTEQQTPSTVETATPSAQAPTGGSEASFASQQEIVNVLHSQVCTKDFEYGCLEPSAIALMKADLGTDDPCAADKYPSMRWNNLVEGRDWIVLILGSDASEAQTVSAAVGGTPMSVKQYCASTS